jgi:hypothetical protein
VGSGGASSVMVKPLITDALVSLVAKFTTMPFCPPSIVVFVGLT